MIPDHSSHIDSLFHLESGKEIDTYLSRYRFGSRTLLWFPMDTQELFEENCLKYENENDEYIKKSLEYYKSNPITYVTNNEVFRDSDLNYKPNEVDVFIGCSYTFGIGVSSEHLWVNKVSSYFDFPTINAGVPGSGPITQFRVLALLSRRFKIRRVYHYTDFYQSRFEWYKSDLLYPELGTYMCATPSSDGTVPVVESLFNDRNRTLLQLFAKNAIKGLCQDKGIELITCYNTETHEFIRFYEDPDNIYPEFSFDYSLDFCARDILHLSVKFNHFIYLLYLSKLGIEVFKKDPTVKKYPEKKLENLI